MAQARDDVRANSEPLDSLNVGRLLAGRYRLSHRVTIGPHTTLWQAVDEVLARPVAVRVLAATADDRTRDTFLAAAARAGWVSHPRAARVYDAGTENGHTYLVGEWVDGVSLDRILRDGPLPAEQAAFLAHQVAEGLAAAHARGVAHGRLHPGNVLVGGGLRVKVTDFAVAAALAGPVPSLAPTRAGRTPAAAADSVSAEMAAEMAADLRALGALLYASLTGRWPGGPAFGLPGAPVRDDGICTPRQIRAGVPNALDSLTGRLLDPARRTGAPAITTADAALAALTSLLAEPPREVIVAGRSRGRSHRALPRVGIAAVAVGAIASAGWFAGYQVGQLPGSPARVPSLAASAKRPTPAPASVPLPLAAVTDFDPPPGDGHEQASFVGAAHDGDRSTAWMTDRYQASPDFGGLKPGVGLLVDLGRPVPVGRVTITLTAPGATIELRAADLGEPPRTLEGLIVADRVQNAQSDLTLTPRGATTARFWLLWLTQLPSQPGGGYRDGIAELAFFRSG